MKNQIHIPINKVSITRNLTIGLKGMNLIKKEAINHMKEKANLGFMKEIINLGLMKEIAKVGLMKEIIKICHIKEKPI